MLKEIDPQKQNEGVNASSLITDLVRIYSPSTHEAKAVHFLVAWMGANGFDAAWVDKAGNACGSRGRADAPHTLILLGHIDTVPGKIQVRVEDGKLYGRGSVDAKGSLCTFAAAVSLAQIPENWRVLVVGAVEEETSSSKGARYLSQVLQPDICVIGEPSGVNRITLGYKGRLSLSYTYSRTMSHTSRPEPSAGAVGSAFWQAILNWTAAQNQGYERAFDQILPHLHEINTSSDGFEETVKMTLSFRLPPRLNSEIVVSAITPLTEGTITVLGADEAYQGDKNNALVRGMLTAIRAQGNQPGFVLKNGTSDMNVVGAVWPCPIIAYGPGDSSLDHTPNEHLPLDEYATAIQTLRHLIEHLN